MKRSALAMASRRNLYVLMGLCLLLLLTTNLMQSSMEASKRTAIPVISLRSLIKYIFGDAYGKKCDAHVQDSSATRLLEEATKVLDKRDTLRPAFFFVETSCDGVVNARQACAVESAALLHPEADVYLLLLSPPANLNIAHNPALKQLTSNYPNVQVVYFHLQEFFRNSPLEKWYQSGELRNSNFEQSHTSDAFRYFTLWKYGGTYMDLDIILLRSLKGLKNFAGAESKEDIAAGVLNLERYSKLATECVNEIRDNFRGDDWGANGPGVITRVLQKLCQSNNTTEMSRERCQDRFEVMPPEIFYPIPWRKWRLYFDEAVSNSTMKMLSKSYAIHVWNKFSIHTEVRIGSRQPYGLLAAKYCPNVYSSCGSVF